MAAQVLPVSSPTSGNFRDSGYTQRHATPPIVTQPPVATQPHPSVTPPLRQPSLEEVNNRLSVSDDPDMTNTTESKEDGLMAQLCELQCDGSDKSEHHPVTTTQPSAALSGSFSDIFETLSFDKGVESDEYSFAKHELIQNSLAEDIPEYSTDNLNMTFSNEESALNTNPLMSDSGIGATFDNNLRIQTSDSALSCHDAPPSPPAPPSTFAPPSPLTPSSLIASTPTPKDHPDTPDSGFSALATSTPALKTPDDTDLTFDPVFETPVTSSTEESTRKRKHVNFDESQTSIVVISPGDLFRTYSRQGEDEEEEVEEESAPLLPVCSETEAIQRQLVDLDPTADLDLSSTKYVLDPSTGWPLKRSESLESRDNPFLPGGSLSREAEDLLSRATIIRDNFILQDESHALLDSHAHPTTSATPPNTGPSPVVEERVSPQTAGANYSSLPPAATDAGNPRANGKTGDSPGDVTDSIPAQPINGAQTGGALIVQDSEEKKRGKKCCSVM